LFLWIAVLACAGVPKPTVVHKPEMTPPSEPLSGQSPAQQAAESPAESIPQAPADPLAPPPSGMTLPAIHFTLQVGAFSTSERAAKQAALLQAAGLDAYFFVDSDHFYKVRFERFDTREAARDRALELQSKRLIDTYFIVQPGPENLEGDPQSVLQESIVQTVRRFVGMPYRWGGASLVDGFDCSGLTMTVYRLNGLDLPRSAFGQYRAGTPVNRDGLRPGDLVFFATAGSNRISHVGIYSGEDRFIHAPGRGKPIRSAALSNKYFSRRYKGARRYF